MMKKVLCLFLSAVFMIGLFPATSSAADKDSDHAYQIVTGHYSWEEARQACLDMGGHLATITSPAEQAYIEELNRDNESLWIGAYLDNGTEWRWVTGEVWSFTNWGAGEPNGGMDEPYACVWPQEWNDLCLDSGEQNGFICEWDDDTMLFTVTFDADGGTLTTASKTVVSGQPYGKLPEPGKTGFVFEGWYTEKNGGGTQITNSTVFDLNEDQTLYAYWTEDTWAKDHRYEIVMERLTWEEANQACLEKGGHLAVITSQREQSYIEALNDSYTLWIGGYEDASKNYRWITGEVWDYSHWRIGEPSGGDEHYACLWPREWNDVRFDYPIDGYICEWNDEIDIDRVFFDADDGALTTESKAVVRGQCYGTLPEPSKTGYIFEGWYTEKNGGGKQITPSTVADLNGDQTLYAYWTKDTWSDSHRYEIVTGHYSWEEASQACLAMGGHLATITSPAEQAYIEKLNRDNERLWIGAYLDDGMEWNWITGEAWSYTNWGSGEPNGGENEPYGCVWPQKWNDLCLDSYEQNGYICEWDDDTVLFTITFDADGGTLTKADKTVVSGQSYGKLPEPRKTGYIFEGWYTEKNGGGKQVTETDTVDLSKDQTLFASWTKDTWSDSHRYEIVSGHFSWEEANQACIRAGGHLATITSAQEQNYIENLNPENRSLWIGGYQDEAMEWHWVTGEAWSYTHWGEGEPNNMGEEHYACVWPQEWNDLCLDSYEQEGYICEWDSTAASVITSLELIYPDNSDIIEGSDLNLDKLTVRAVYSDGLKTEVKDYSVSGYDPEKLGSQVITISYEGHTAQFTVTVIKKTLTGISVTQKPDKLIYGYGEPLNTAGLEVTALFDNGSSETIRDYTLSGYQKDVPGTQTVLVSYQDCSACFSVTVTEDTETSAVAKPVISIESYLGGKQLRLSTTTKNAAIYYTLDEKVPDSSATLYDDSHPIRISTTTTVKAVAVLNGNGQKMSSVTSGRIAVSAVATPEVSHKSGFLDQGTIVTLRCDTVGSTIYYTTDGSDPVDITDPSMPRPSETCRQYTGAIAIQSSTVLNATAFKDGYHCSDVCSATYIVNKTAESSEEVKISLGSVSVSAGNIASVPVYVFADADITYFRTAVQFDRAMFDSTVTVTPAEGVDASDLFCSVNGDMVALLYDASSPIRSGELCTINFSTLAGLAAETSISLSVVLDKSMVSTTVMEKAPLSDTEGAVITIREMYAGQPDGEVIFTANTGESITTAEDLNGQTSVEASFSLGEQVYATEKTDSAANLYLAIYDREKRMVSVDTWKVDISDPMFLFTRTITIPEDIEVGSIKIMLLSDQMIPLMAASELGAGA